MAHGGILGKKVGMTQIFDDTGKCIPVTVLSVGPCTVVQKKTREVEGYAAVQIGYEPLKESKVNKPMAGHFKKNESKPFRHLKEIRLTNEDDLAVGQSLDVKLFQVGDCIDVIGTSKGKGFQGVIKRHGFKGGPGAHGSHFHRVPGSIGQCTTPGEVMKGQKLPGRMGGDQVTTRNLKVVAIRPDENLILTKGAVPGPNDGLIFVRLVESTFGERVKAAAPQEEAAPEPEAAAEETPAEQAPKEEAPADAEKKETE